MAIEELEKKLYRPAGEEEEKKIPPGVFYRPKAGEKLPTEWEDEGGLAGEKKPFFEFTSKTKKIILFSGIGVLGAAILIAAGLFLYGRTSFDVKSVTIEILGPREIKAGDRAVYTVVYKNGGRLPLADVNLYFNLPENSELVKKAGIEEIEAGKLKISLDTVNTGEESRFEIAARIFGAADEIKTVDAVLSYLPQGFSAEFKSETSFTSTISNVPLVLTFEMLENATAKQDFSAVLHYVSNSGGIFKNMAVKIEYPNTFSFKTADPEPFKDNVWNIGDLDPGEEGKVTVFGTIDGFEGENKIFNADIGYFDASGEWRSYLRVVGATKISSSPLVLTQIVNGASVYNAKIGELLSFQLNYRNNSNIGLAGVIIAARLDGAAFDLKSVKVDNGVFDGKIQSAVWNAATKSELSFLDPGEEGSVTFSVKTGDPLPIKDFNSKNFVISSTAKIYTETKPQELAGIPLSFEIKTEMKVITRLVLKAIGQYSSAPIPNTGPIPPRVGQTTTYNIVWQLINVSNDMEEVEVESSLPPNVEWLGQISPVGSNIEYNKGTGKIIWRVGKLPAATGILRPVVWAAFKVAIVPAPLDIGHDVQLIYDSSARGKDAFVGQIVGSDAGQISTYLVNDPEVGQEGGSVKE